MNQTQPSGAEILLRFVLHSLTPMFLEGHDDNPKAARLAAFQALAAYEVSSIADLLLAFRIIAFDLAEAKCTLAALNGHLTRLHRREFQEHANIFKGTVQRHAMFLESNDPAIAAQMDTHRQTLTAWSSRRQMPHRLTRLFRNHLRHQTPVTRRMVSFET